MKALDRAVLRYREDPSPANHAALMLAMGIKDDDRQRRDAEEHRKKNMEA